MLNHFYDGGKDEPYPRNEAGGDPERILLESRTRNLKFFSHSFT